MSASEDSALVIVLMGVSGAGKTTIGYALADRLGWAFHDGDDLHPEANISKMEVGEPLNDADRGPWLDSIRELIRNLLIDERSAIVACSALKKSYRKRILEGNERAQVVYLKGSEKLLLKRLREREGHFMDAEMLTSQLEALELPASDENVLTIDVHQEPNEIVDEICEVLSLEPSTSAG